MGQRDVLNIAKFDSLYPNLDKTDTYRKIAGHKAVALSFDWFKKGAPPDYAHPYGILALDEKLITRCKGCGGAKSVKTGSNRECQFHHCTEASKIYFARPENWGPFEQMEEDSVIFQCPGCPSKFPIGRLLAHLDIAHELDGHAPRIYGYGSWDHFFRFCA